MKIFKYAVLLVLLVYGALAAAQSESPVITLDDVHRVAERLYCPVCENIPLDDCGTTTCMQWKSEIELLLREGKTPDEIVDSFVAQYGEHVVGIPQNPTLRALSFVPPLLLALGLIGLGVVMFLRFGRGVPAAATASAPTAGTPSAEDALRARIEQDLG